MLRAIDIVNRVTKKAYPNYTRAFETGDALFAKFEIVTPIRMAHFLAQALYETGSLTVLFENMRYKTEAQLLKIFGVGHHSAAIRPEEVEGLLDNPEALAERVYGLGNPKKAAKLGNTQPGDGYRYRGGGLLQTTGGDSYRKMGKLAGADFAGDPNLIVDPTYALKPALQEWGDGKLNPFADRNDIRTITRVINGGYNGLPGRQALFDKLWPIVNEDADAASAVAPAWKAASTDDDTRWLQESLNDMGVDPPLLVDGRYGPATVDAVKWFQRIALIKPDGVFGDVTRAALNLRLDAKSG